MRGDRDTRIEVHKGSGQRYRSTLHRADGVRVELDGGGYNRIGGRAARVPHDLAHLVVEEAFGLRLGLWGVLAAGGIVQNAALAGGRRPPHALDRARRIADGAGEQLRQAEVLVRATADLALAGGPPDPSSMRAAVGDRWWTPAITAAALANACAGLHDAAVRWQELPAGGCLERTWRLPDGMSRRRRARA